MFSQFKQIISGRLPSRFGSSGANNHARGFTLVEILFTVAIIGLLSGIAMVSLNGATDRARISKSLAFSNSLRSALLSANISEWTFDDGSGTAVKDTWGGNNGNFSGSPVWKSGGECVSGSCLEFNGSNYIDCGNNSNLNATEMTVEAWIYPYDLSAGLRRDVVTKGNSSVGFEWNLSLENGGSPEFIIFNNTANNYYLAESVTPLTINRWYHLVGIVNKNAAYVYVDGRQAAIATTTSGTRQPPGSAKVFIAARETLSPDTMFSGKIDTVRMYSQPMIASTVKQHYLDGLDQLYAKGAIDREEYRQRVADLENEDSYADNR